jgi:hypothetical protein
MALQQRQRRGPVLVLVVVGLAAIGLGAYFFLSSRVPKVAPVIAAADEAALDLLRRDDEVSLRKAIESWQAIEAKAPDYVPAKANQIMAEEILTFDLRDEIRRLTAQYAAAEKEMKKHEEKKDSPDWPARANAKREELLKIKAKMDPLVDEAAAHDDRAGQLIKDAKELSKTQQFDGASVFRASALYYALKTNDTADKLAKMYKTAEDPRAVLHDPQRAFADLAVSALHAQLRINQDKYDAGMQAAQEALKKDSKLLRAMYLQARLEFAMKKYAEAKRTLTELLVMNPAHLQSQKLKSEIERAEQAPKSGAAPEGDDK